MARHHIRPWCIEQASLLLAVLVFSLFLCACSDARLPGSARASDEPSPAVSTRRPTSARLLPLTRVEGRVITQRGTPLGNEPFVLVDRAGFRVAGATGVLGQIEVASIETPYDLRVRDRAFFGVTRSDPVVQLDLEEVSTRTAEVEVEVHAPPCGRDPCIVDVVSVSVTGSGRATGFGVPAVVTVLHEFRDEMADLEVHVLVHDVAFTTVAYARVFDASGRVVVEASSVETRELNVDEDATVTLDLPGGAAFAVRSRLPLVDDASWRMERRAEAPPTKSTLHRSSRAWSGSLAMDSEPPALPLPTGPEIDGPQAAGFSWSADPRTLFTVDVAGYRLVTSGHMIAWRPLGRLGFPALEPGAHTFSLTTAPFATVDEALSPDADERGRRFDARREGAETSETIPFVVQRGKE